MPSPAQEALDRLAQITLDHERRLRRIRRIEIAQRCAIVAAILFGALAAWFRHGGA